jgi:hypothetical protein
VAQRQRMIMRHVSRGGSANRYRLASNLSGLPLSPDFAVFRAEISVP